MPKAKQIKKETKSENYIVSLTLNGKKYNLKGKTIGEAMSQIPPQVIKEKLVITISKGNKKVEKMFYPFQTKKLLISKVSQDIFEKRLFF